MGHLHISFNVQAYKIYNSHFREKVTEAEREKEGEGRENLILLSNSVHWAYILVSSSQHL